VRFLSVVFLFFSLNAALGQTVLSLPSAPKAKYDAASDRLSYVLDEAIQGGSISLASPKIDFNSFNPFIRNAWPAEGSERLYATLMFQPLDDEKNLYPYVAKEYEQDGSSVTFTLRDGATFSDGSSITTQDVAASFAVIKEKGKRDLREGLESVEFTLLDDQKIRFHTKVNQALSAEQKFKIGWLPIFKAPDLNSREQLKKPITSGPYEVEHFHKINYVQYKKRPNWWGNSLWFHTNRYNFERMSYFYIPNPEMNYRAFRQKKYLLRRELNPQWWHHRYDFDAVRQGKVEKKTVRNDQTLKAGGIFLNTRKPALKNLSVRRLLQSSFDFQQLNHTCYFDSYSYLPSLFFDAKIIDFSKNHQEKSQDLIHEMGIALEESKNSIVTSRLERPVQLIMVALVPAHKKILEPWKMKLKKYNIDLIIQMTTPGEYFKRLQTGAYDMIVVPQISGVDWPSISKSLGDFILRAVDTNQSFERETLRLLLKKIQSAPTDFEEKLYLSVFNQWAFQNAYFIPMWFRSKIDYASWLKVKIPEATIGQSDIDHWCVAA